MSTPVIIGLAVVALMAFAFVVFLLVAGVSWAILRSKKKAAEPAVLSTSLAYSAPRLPDEVERDEMAALAMQEFHTKWAEQKQASRVKGFHAVMSGGVAAE